MGCCAIPVHSGGWGIVSVLLSSPDIAAHPCVASVTAVSCVAERECPVTLGRHTVFTSQVSSTKSEPSVSEQEQGMTSGYCNPQSCFRFGADLVMPCLFNIELCINFELWYGSSLAWLCQNNLQMRISLKTFRSFLISKRRYQQVQTKKPLDFELT